MQQNIGLIDRGLRIALAAVLIGVLLQEQRTGAPLVFWLAVAALLLGTGVFGYCPIYSLLGISTRRVRPH
ncbi:DUF2892 domain-containing protein [Hymenobacter aquaticus]|uniref:DUF2892 domain-containing protein n=1 Tax=Hymenobacter aquaticus TaxID=1867101 RepID=A0A4Z0Q5E5_9BACT|nr:DUF2892 domain-containing protein [Hymenobacter aquaticus]TGE24291.1 DUF2892 domain-containing protein [Hymenobacter aquaticus]